MNLITHSQLFYINSKDRIHGTESNFVVKLSNIDRNANFNHVAVLQAIIPKSYYLISEGNNTFTLKEGTDEVHLSIAIGNYSKISFKNYIQTLLNSNSPNQFLYKIQDDNFFAKPDTGKFTFIVSNNGGVQPSFIMTSEVHRQFGFYDGSTNTFENDTLTSSHFIDFSLHNILYIHSNICQNTTSDNILQEIYTTGIPTASYVKYDCYQLEAYSKPFNSKSDTYQFYLTDENDVPIDINGINIEITVLIYEKNNLDAHIKNYIEMNQLKNRLRLIQNKPS